MSVSSTSFKKGHKGWNAGTRRTITYICAGCGETVTKYYRKDLKHKYCSTSCWAKSPENNALVIRRKTGENHHMWAGDAVCYGSLHAWVRRHLGSPRECENCLATDKVKYEWANISGEYRRDLSDWARLCVSCHHLFDDVERKMNAKK